MENTNRPYFFHSAIVEGKHRVTIAGIVEGNELKIGASACSPKDNFSKKIGRSIALGRATKKPCSVSTVVMGWTESKSIKSRLIAISEKIIKKPALANPIII